MKLAYRYDIKGAYIEPVEIHPDKDGKYVIPDNCTIKPLPQPNWKPVFKNGNWVETATEKDKNIKPQEKSEIDILKEEILEMKLAMAEMSLTAEENNLAAQLGLAELGEMIGGNE